MDFIRGSFFLLTPNILLLASIYEEEELKLGCCGVSGDALKPLEVDLLISKGVSELHQE